MADTAPGDGRHICITGASGGLGGALAEAYAEEGVFLTLWGRDAQRLAAVEARCRARGAQTQLVRQDARALEACRATLLAVDAQRPVDLAFCNAGVSSGASPDGGLESARDALHGGPLRLSIVYPGYVDTPMSRRLKGPQPLRWSAEKAAAHIRRRLDQGADDIVFPRTLAWGIRLLHLLPMPLAAFFTRRFACVVEPDGEAPFAPQGGPQQGSNDA